MDGTWMATVQVVPELLDVAAPGEAPERTQCATSAQRSQQQAVSNALADQAEAAAEAGGCG